GTLPPAAQEELLAAASPVRLHAREWLFREGDDADRLYFVVSGRLRVVVEHDGETRIARLLGPGAAIGELAILTGAPRSASVQAVRDSELLEIESDRFLDLLVRDPEFGAELARSLARQLQQSGGLVAPDSQPSVFTVVPVAGVEASPFIDALQEGFAGLGPTALLDRPDGGGWSAELAALEAGHAHVLLVARPDDAEWADFCLRQADRVLLVAGGAPPAPLPAVAECELALLGAPTAETVAAWRTTFSVRAHHVVPEDDPEAPRRVARRLAGRSLGLVLSGGGARAFAHLGVLEVLAEEGFAVDRVGGTSMGAFISAMVALGWTTERMLETCRIEVAQRAPFSDYTLPRYALIRARRAESMLRRVFGDVWVEELPRPLFTVSADLLSGQMVVHRDGSLVEAVGASMAIPGLAPPVSHGAQLLIDGGVLNNLPIDLMVADEPGPVLAVDVMRRVAIDELATTPGSSLPTILETLSRATVLGSIERAEANRGLARIVIAPDVQQVSLRDFRRLETAVEEGRRAAEEALAAGAKVALLDALAERAPAAVGG
ncbi:MAG TPA: patatin-like phospholipase family protein, partial [Gaiellaceae bacterium]|nr:patatin-like phospholipase family protein [Gaiellaceae bacterium]